MKKIKIKNLSRKEMEELPFLGAIKLFGGVVVYQQKSQGIKKFKDFLEKQREVEKVS